MGILYRVTVKPRSGETKIVKEDGDRLIIAVHAPPEEGKANVELIKFLSKRFSADVKILRGLGSRKKIVLVSEKKCM